MWEDVREAFVIPRSGSVVVRRDPGMGIAPYILFGVIVVSCMLFVTMMRYLVYWSSIGWAALQERRHRHDHILDPDLPTQRMWR